LEGNGQGQKEKGSEAVGIYDSEKQDNHQNERGL
jgi:hypothetical protein